MLSSILSNRPYANEHVYILARLWPHRMVDGISTARAVRSRGMHNIGLGDEISDRRLPASSEPPTTTEGETVMESPASPDPTPTKDNHLTSTMPATLKREDDPQFCGYGLMTSPVT